MLDMENTWTQSIVFVLIWTAIYTLLGLAFNEDLTSQAIQGVLGGITFSVVWQYLQRRKQE